MSKYVYDDQDITLELIRTRQNELIDLSITQGPISVEMGALLWNQACDELIESMGKQNLIQTVKEIEKRKIL